MEKKKLSFNYDLSALPEYNSYGSDMLIKSILGLTLPSYSTIKANLKGTTQKVGWLQNDIVLQDESCGWNPTGDTVQNLVTIDLCNKKINQSLCAYDLYDTYLSQSLSNSNFQETVPFEEVIMTDISNRVANKIEKALWNNSTATGATEYNNQCFDGLVRLITSGNGATQIAYTASTASNGLDVFTTIYQNIPSNVLHRDDLIIYCSYSNYRALVSSMRNNSYINLFTADFGGVASNGLDVFTSIYENIPSNVLHRDDLVIYCSYSNYRALVSSMRNNSYINLFTADFGGVASGEQWALTLPGTNVKVVPTVGLDGVSAYYAGPSQYVMVGMNAELQTIKAMYDPFVDEIKINLHTSYGVGVFDPASFCICK